VILFVLRYVPMLNMEELRVEHKAFRICAEELPPSYHREAV